MNRAKTAVVLLVAAALALAGCGSSEDPALQERNAKQQSVVKCGAANESLECKNLKERERRNSQPNAVGYVYLYNFDGSVKGYFVIKGKVSSTQSQMGPMDDIVDACDSSYCPEVMEAAGDDGSYGPNEQGIFFFTVEGTMVTYSGEYVLSDAPLKLSDNKLN
jgi:hypothetical protein